MRNMHSPNNTPIFQWYLSIFPPQEQKQDNYFTGERIKQKKQKRAISLIGNTKNFALISD